MIELLMEQGSQEWQLARLGIPTASQFHRILTPNALKSSAQAASYICEKVAERVLGFPVETTASPAMLRGSLTEEQAVAWYEFQHDATTRKSGICLTDDRTVGASVDRFVGEDGILEVKCPLPAKHIAMLLGVDEHDHRLQRQGQLWLSGRKWHDLLSFCPELPPYENRVERDEDAIARIEDEVSRFCVRLDFSERKVRAMLAGEIAA